MNDNSVIDALYSSTEEWNDEPANVVDGLFAIAEALNNIARALERLGVNNAATSMGAIEILSLEIKEGFRFLRERMK